MSEQNINPERITKPIQLLAAWLIGLIAVNGSFLAAATQILIPTWAPIILVIASIINVPLFLISIFLLQTRFRPEMQADEFYSKYLENKYSGEQAEIKNKSKESLDEWSSEIAQKIIDSLGPELNSKKIELEKVIKNEGYLKIKEMVKNSRCLSELYTRPNNFSNIVDQFIKHNSFIRDIEMLEIEGLVTIYNSDFKSAELTALGNQIAKELKSEQKLWNQKHPKVDLLAGE
jgi:hypothetical protein